MKGGSRSEEQSSPRQTVSHDRSSDRQTNSDDRSSDRQMMTMDELSPTDYILHRRGRYKLGWRTN